MKKIAVLLILATVLFANQSKMAVLESIGFNKKEFHLVPISPVTTRLENPNTKQYNAIFYGHQEQLLLLTTAIQNCEKNLKTNLKLKRFDTATFPIPQNLIRDLTDADQLADRRLKDLIRNVHERYVQKNKTQKKPLNISMSMDNIDDIQIDMEDMTEISQQADKKDFYKTAFVASILDINSYYKPADFQSNIQKITFPFYTTDPKHAVEEVNPTVFFGQFFEPEIQGRTYTMSIHAFLFVVDSDGDARVMVQPINTFEWKRNYRIISAHTGEIIKSIISQMTGAQLVGCKK